MTMINNNSLCKVVVYNEAHYKGSLRALNVS